MIEVNELSKRYSTQTAVGREYMTTSYVWWG
jgi:hypothetical protein